MNPIPFATAPLRVRAVRLRADLARALLPRLTVGVTLPRARVLASALGCSPRAAAGHLRAAMAGAGVVLATVRCPVTGRPRLRVERMPP